MFLRPLRAAAPILIATVLCNLLLPNPALASERSAPSLTNASADAWQGRIALGNGFTVAAQPEGAVHAWGSNYKGQLGNGTRIDATVPTRTLIADAVQVAANGFQGAAVRSDGTVWEWGSTGMADTGVTEPVQVAGLTDVVSAAVGGLPGGTAVKADGTAWYWWGMGGASGVHQIEELPFPVKAVAAGQFANLYLDELGFLWTVEGGTIVDLVPLETEALTMASGERHALAVQSDGTVMAWGDNDYGQLGDGRTYDQYHPVLVRGLTDVTMVATGSRHSLALKADGTVWAWGDNQYGLLGDGTQTDRLLPVRVVGLSDVVAIAAGASHSLAMQADGTLWAWGYNGSGQLGDGTNEYRLTPVQVRQPVSDAQAPLWPEGAQLTFPSIGLTTVTMAWPEATDDTAVVGYRVYVDGVQAAETEGHSQEVRWLNVGQAYAFSVSAGDAAGNWSPWLAGTASTVALQPEDRVIAASAHRFMSYVLKEDGWWMWGEDTAWAQTHSLPVRLTEPEAVVELAHGHNHALALLNDGTVWAWGTNDRGQLGNGTSGDGNTWEPPAPVAGLTHVKQVTADVQHSVALKHDGTVWVWGAGDSGQLGDGTGADRLLPVQVPGLSGVTAVVTASRRTLALKQDGTVWAWGFNYSGQLGDGTTENRMAPVQVKDLGNVTAVAAGGVHSLALRADGTVWAWGNNNAGQLGYWGQENRMTPVQVAGIATATAVAAGDSHSMALLDDGSVWTWGGNDRSQLGDGTNTLRPTPEAIPGLTARAIIAGDRHSFAVGNDDTLWAWGDVGLASLSNTHQPVPVDFPAPDSAAPQWAGESLVAENVGRTTATLRWEAPAEPDGVSYYRLYQDGQPIGTVAGNVLEFVVAGLAPGTAYSFQVQARDAQGNWSTDGPMVTVTTAPPDREAPVLITHPDGKPDLSLLMLWGETGTWFRPTAVTPGAITFMAREADQYRIGGTMNEPVSRVVVNGDQVEAVLEENSFSFVAHIKYGATSHLKIEVYDLSGNKTTLHPVLVQSDTPAPRR